MLLPQRVKRRQFTHRLVPRRGLVGFDAGICTVSSCFISVFGDTVRATRRSFADVLESHPAADGDRYLLGSFHDAGLFASNAAIARACVRFSSTAFSSSVRLGSRGVRVMANSSLLPSPEPQPRTCLLSSV